LNYNRVPFRNAFNLGSKYEIKHGRAVFWWFYPPNGMQALIVRTTAESGDGIVRFWHRLSDDGFRVPLQLQILEGDYLDIARTMLPHQYIAPLHSARQGNVHQLPGLRARVRIRLNPLAQDQSRPTGGFKVIYLVTPYTDPRPAVMRERFEAACRIAAAVIGRGQVVFSPIVHCHPLAVEAELPRDWKYWRGYACAMLHEASQVVVARMPGWRQSRGVTAEINLARRAGIPIAFSRPEHLVAGGHPPKENE
jgi:hypothetical protein